MRNVAFSVMMVALALLQVAVVTTELSPSKAQTATVANSAPSTTQVLASNETVRTTSTL
jgi:hypothetical protein